MTALTRTHLLNCIRAAEASDFLHYAAILRELYRREFGEDAPKTDTQRRRQAVKESHNLFGTPEPHK